MPILKTLRKFWTGDTQTRELRLVHRAQLKTISDGDGLLYVWSGDIHLLKIATLTPMSLDDLPD